MVGGGGGDRIANAAILFDMLEAPLFFSQHVRRGWGKEGRVSAREESPVMTAELALEMWNRLRYNQWRAVSSCTPPPTLP